MSKPIFTVDTHADGQRLDNFLLKQRKHVPAGKLYKFIRKGQIRINGKRCRPATKLSDGDQVRVPPFIFFAAPEKQPDIPVSMVEKLCDRITWENEDYLVVNKPPGLAVHTGTGHEYGVIEILQQQEKYRHILLAHRLDVVTSGCLLLAKNRAALLAFQKLLKNRQVKKTYVALLQGELGKATTVIQPLQETRIQGIKTAVVDQDGKSAKTHIEPLAVHSGITLALCSPVTGRTHQIRAHCAHLKCPTVGDHQYGATPRPDLSRSVYLHARQIAFAGFCFEAAEPASFKQLLLR